MENQVFGLSNRFEYSNTCAIVYKKEYIFSETIESRFFYKSSETIFRKKIPQQIKGITDSWHLNQSSYEE